MNININDPEIRNRFTEQELEEIRLAAEREANKILRDEVEQQLQEARKLVEKLENLQTQLKAQAWVELLENWSFDDNEYYEDEYDDAPCGICNIDSDAPKYIYDEFLDEFYLQ